MNERDRAVERRQSEDRNRVEPGLASEPPSVVLTVGWIAEGVSAASAMIADRRRW